MNWNEYLAYDETSPTCLRWLVSTSNNVKVGQPAGAFSKGSRVTYAEVRVANKRSRNHRVIWEMFNGPIPEGMWVDHINHDSKDNRICNLRLATREQNQQNRGKAKHNTSGYKGVWFCSRMSKWVAEIRANRKRKVLGYFDLPEEAAAAYNKAAAELHGEFARS